MDRRKGVVTALEIAVVVLLIALVAGQLLGQPILLGFVETGSMEPTLHTGDGFVALPAALAGPVEEGDVVTFQAEELHGGGLTTHRIVEVTGTGYVTKGDANPFTDQDGGEPIVKKPQIVAVAWQPGGAVLPIPGVGALVTGTRAVLQGVQRQLAVHLGLRSVLGTQGLAYVFLSISVVAYVVDLYLSRGRSRESRSRSRDDGTSVRLILLVFAGAIVLAATATMVAPAGQQMFGIVSADSDSPRPDVIEQGTSESIAYRVGNGGMVPVMVFLEPKTDGVAIQPGEMVVGSRSTLNATLTLTAPPETGYYRQYLTEYRYMYVLPRPMIRALYAIHPWLPIVVIDAVLGVPFYLIGISVAGSGRLRSRSRTRPSQVSRFLKRF